ncbi:MAG TPA: FG-GAP-like repeat-containing protein, partial [Caldilineaceae bacterium]|nr:FG-GAP-like repeat-containing protein [Caldilineaceae bacterium]
ENLGASSLTWAMNRIDTGASGVLHIHAADLDGDGDADLVTALELMNAVRWYENLGTKPPTFAMHVITENARAVHAVYAADADQDGDQDIFAAIEGNNTVAWYENLGGKPPTFAERIIVNNTAVAHGIDAADIDGDGDLDALSASRADGKVAWYENVGGQYAFSSEVDPENSRLLHLVISSRGRPGDPDLALRYVELQLQDDRGAPLTTEQANALIERINVYRVACCDRILDPTSSPLMATVAPLEVSDGGRLLIPLLEIDPNTRIPAGGSAAFAV